MIVFVSVLTIPVLYLLLWYWLPKGNIVHEGIRIPFHLLKLRRLASTPMQVEKISFGPHRRQYLLLCTPPNGVTQPNAIIYYHGGAWMFGRPEMFYANAGFFIERGHAVVMPSYRRPPFHRYPSIREDLSLALRRSVDILAEKQIPVNGWITSGMSAGASLAALLALDHQALVKAGLDPKQIKAMLLMGAPLDLSAMPSSIPLHSFAGWRHSPTFTAANPMNYLPVTRPIPLLSIHGTKDGLVPYPAAANFIQHWPEGYKELYTIPHGTHLDCSAYMMGDKKMQKLITHWLDNNLNLG